MKQLLVIILLISFVNASESNPTNKPLLAKNKASDHYYLSVAKKLDKRTTLSSILAETEEMNPTDALYADYLKHPATMLSLGFLRPGPYRPP